MSSERLLLYDVGSKFKKTKTKKSQFKETPKGEYPPVYPMATDDPDKLINFLDETLETLNWVMSHWSVYHPDENIPKKSFSRMWKIAKMEFKKIRRLLPTNYLEMTDSKKNIHVEKELRKKGLTKESLDSKLLLVEFGNVEMLLAYEDYENSSKSIHDYSITSKIAKKLGPQILKIRKLENRVGLSKWLGAAIIIIGSILDALGIKSLLTEFLDLLALYAS